jgi:hypothetical protein
MGAWIVMIWTMEMCEAYLVSTTTWATTALPSLRSLLLCYEIFKMVNKCRQARARGVCYGYKYAGVVRRRRHSLSVTYSTFSLSSFLGAHRLFFQPHPWIITSTHERSRWRPAGCHRTFELSCMRKGEFLSNVLRLGSTYTDC